MKIQRCKGMRDLKPAEMGSFRLVEDVFRNSCRRWGYGEVRTPTIEYLHLFTSAGTLTPTMLGKVYSFLDWDGWSGERVVLRPDGTIPVARLYTEGLEGLARLFYAANIFIFEEAPEKPRERWQCGAELIGAGSTMADAELISLSLEVLQKLGIKGVELRLSHAGLVKALLARLGLGTEERDRLFDRILDGDAAAVGEAGALGPLLSLKGQSPGFLRRQRAILGESLPEVMAPLDDFLGTVAVLDDLGIKYNIDVASGAGFEYYTGVIFQLYAGGEKVGGGGRYDALIPSMGGKDVPASGFALYIDRLMRLVKPVTLTKPASESVIVRAKYSSAIKAAFAAAAGLREAGYIIELDLDGRETASRWFLEVEIGLLVLSDKVESKHWDLTSLNEVLVKLEGEGAGQDSPA
jgi:histidyl-tRNA synthetase